MGACAGTSYVTGFTVLQENVSDELRGRTFATLYTVIRLCLLISLDHLAAVGRLLGLGHRAAARPTRPSSIGPYTYALPGVRIALWGGGLITLVAGLVAWRSIRRAERTAAESGEEVPAEYGPIEPIRPLGLVEPSPVAEPIEPTADERIPDDEADAPTRSARRAARGRSRAVTRGRFVVVEGGDGSGKSTQARGSRSGCARRASRSHETFEPGAARDRRGDPRAAAPRPASRSSPIAEALLMAADRAQHVAAEIEPALARGEWVVCDRYVPSSLVYQGVVRGLGVDVVEQLNAVATAGLEPDLVVVLDVTDDVAAARQAGEPDRLEARGRPSSTPRCVRAYRDLAREHGWVVVDGDGAVDDVARACPRRRRAGAGRMTSAVASERWARVVGQDRAVALLQRAAERPVHAYLLVGPRGSGVEEAARCFAAALVAPDGDDRAWDLALRGVHPDVVEIDPPQLQIRIEDAQLIIDEASRSPIEGERKVIIVVRRRALRLNDAAANKLLKTLEEPPPRALIVLVTAGADQLLPTIRSRCQRVDFAFLGADRSPPRCGPTASRPSGPSSLARLAGGRLDRARALDGRLGPVRDAFVDAAGARRRQRGRGRGAGRAGAGRAARGGRRPRGRAGRRGRSSSRPSSRRPATPSGRGARSCDGSTSGTSARTGSARTDALLEGITALETVYRDALAGPGAERLNLDRDVAGARRRRGRPRPRSTRAATLARRSRAQPERDAALERLLLHLPAADAGSRSRQGTLGAPGTLTAAPE